jgi:hypothetical protein
VPLVPPSPLEVPLVLPSPLEVPLVPPSPLVLPVLPVVPLVEDPLSDDVPPVDEFTLLLPVPRVPDESPDPVVPVPVLPLSEPIAEPVVDPPSTPGLVPAEPATPPAAAPFREPVVPAPAVVPPVVPAVPAPEKPTQSGVVRYLPVAGSKQSARRCVLDGSVGSELTVPVAVCDQADAATNAVEAARAAARVLSLNRFMEPPPFHSVNGLVRSQPRRFCRGPARIGASCEAGAGIVVAVRPPAWGLSYAALEIAAAEPISRPGCLHDEAHDPMTMTTRR